MKRLLFVCTANRCRSPMAERLFKKILHSKGQPPEDWLVTSAGTWAVDGSAPDDKLIATMDGFDINIRDHRSRMINKSIIENQDLVLVMAFHHYEALQFEFPDQSEAIFLISAMIGKHFEISDPFSGPISGYQRAADQINEILTQGYSKILQLTGG